MQTVREVMTDTVWTIPSTATIREAARTMAKHKVGFLPVIHERVSAGVITDRDIVVRVIAEQLDPDTTYVGSIVSAEQPSTGPESEEGGIASLPEDTSIEDASRFMDEKHVRRVTVHDQNYQIIGVVSRADLPVATATSRA